MSFAERIGIGASAEHRAIAEFSAAGWVCLPHGLAQVGKAQMRLITMQGEADSTDFVVFCRRHFFFVEVKSKTELDKGGYGIDAIQWQTLLAHDQLFDGRVILCIQDRGKDTMLAASMLFLKAAATLSFDERYVIFPNETFRPLANFLERMQKWIA